MASLAKCTYGLSDRHSSKHCGFHSLSCAGGIRSRGIAVRCEQRAKEVLIGFDVHFLLHPLDLLVIAMRSQNSSNCRVGVHVWCDASSSHASEDLAREARVPCPSTSIKY